MDSMGQRGGVVGWVLTLDLVLLTDCTSINKVFDEGSKSQPLEVPFEDGLGAKDAHMAQERR